MLSANQKQGLQITQVHQILPLQVLICTPAKTKENQVLTQEHLKTTAYIQGEA